MLKQDLQFFDRPENTTGALISRLDTYPQAVFELMGFNIALILQASVSVIACSILALSTGWRLGVVVVFAGLPPMLLAGYLRTRVESAMDQKISKNFATSASIASESVTAIRTVSSLSIEKIVLGKYTQELDRANSTARRPILLAMAAFAFTQSVEYWFLALDFWLALALQYWLKGSSADFVLQKVRMSVDVFWQSERGQLFRGLPGCLLFRPTGFNTVWLL